MYQDDRALIMVGETYHTADMYYLTHHLFPDPVIYVDKGGGNTLIACGDFERDHAAAHSKASRVRAFRDYGVYELPADMPEHARRAELALRVLRSEGVDQAVTTNTMPLNVADHLRTQGVDLICIPDLLEKPREVKNALEIAAIETAQRATERAMAAAIGALADAQVGHDGLLYRGLAVVTSEYLRSQIDASLLEDGCSGDGTITASGADTAQPHNVGHGPIHAGRPVIIDIFPRHTERRYYADMTRTVSKGSPPAEITRMYHVTGEALELALQLIRPGVAGREVFEAVCRWYEDHGYRTYLRDNAMPEEGFVHGLGHGVGLDIHEGPHVSWPDDILHAGQVITVEPGLYVPGMGGVRIEDMIVVTDDGCRTLTNFPKNLLV